MKKIYLSRAQTRAMAFEHPIGDPTGGAAYGEKRDPVSATFAIGTMAFTAEAAFAGSLMAGLAFGGAALSLVGNITGNKTLSQVGMVAGLVGGAGMMGAFGEAAQGATWGSTFGEGATASNAAGSLSQTPGSPTPSTPGPQTPIVDGASVSGSVDVAKIDTALKPADYSLTPNSGGTGPLNSAGAGTPNINQAPGGIGIKGPLPAGATPPADTGILSTIKGAGGSMMDMVKGNPMGAYVLAQGAGAAANWLSGKTDAELAALKSQTGYADAQAQQMQLAIDKEKQRRINLNSGYTTVNTSMTVNPTAQVTQPWAQQQQQQPPGLINAARPA